MAGMTHILPQLDLAQIIRFSNRLWGDRSTPPMTLTTNEPYRPTVNALPFYATGLKLQFFTSFTENWPTENGAFLHTAYDASWCIYDRPSQEKNVS